MSTCNGYRVFVIRVDEDSFNLVQQLKKDTGLSEREILGYSSKPCDCCRLEDVAAFNSKDKSVKIKRGILFKSLLTKHGDYKKKKQ